MHVCESWRATERDWLEAACGHWMASRLFAEHRVEWAERAACRPEAELFAFLRLSMFISLLFGLRAQTSLCEGPRLSQLC